MKNIIGSISSFWKKNWFHFLMGMLYGASMQGYIRCLLPIMTPDQHKLFWIVTVFVWAPICAIACAYTQKKNDKLVYRMYSIILTIIGIILVLHYFLSQYISFQWI